MATTEEDLRRRKRRQLATRPPRTLPTIAPEDQFTVPPFGQNRPGPAGPLPNPFPRTTEELRSLPRRVADEARDIVRPGATAGQRGAAIRETAGAAISPAFGLVEDIVKPIAGGIGAAARGIGGFLNPFLPDKDQPAVGGGAKTDSEVATERTARDEEPLGPTDAELGRGAPTTIADGANTRVIPTPPAAPEESQFHKTGRLRDLPEGFTQVIKGTDIGFSDPAGNQFRQIPGVSVEESQRVAGLSDPGRTALREEDIQRTRVNAESLRATADVLRARAASTELGFNDQGQLRRFAVNADGSRSEVPVDPFVESLLTSQDDIQVIEAGSINPVTLQPAENTLLVNLTQQKVLGNFTRELNDQTAEAMFSQLGGETATSQEELEEIVSEIEGTLGPQLNLRRAVGLSGQ